MAMNAVDKDLAGAYKRHGGPLKAWKHFGKSRGKKALGKGKDMISYFKNKIGDMKGKIPEGGMSPLGAGAVGAGKTAAKAIRGKMNEGRMSKMHTLSREKKTPSPLQKKGRRREITKRLMEKK